MIPIGGLSLIAHSIILLSKPIKKTFKNPIFKFRGNFLHWGLKINSKVCLALFKKDSFLQQVFAFLIIFSVFSMILSLATFASLSLYLKTGSNFSLVNDLINARSVIAREKNTNVQVLNFQFKEIPFAKEILEADSGAPVSTVATEGFLPGENILPEAR